MKNLTIEIQEKALAVLASETALTGKLAVKTLTFPSVAASTEGDFIILKDTNRVSWGVALDKDGGGVANAGPLFTAISADSKMAVATISGLTTAIQVAGACVTALNLIPGFTGVFTLVDVGNGTVTMTSVARNTILVPVPLDADESGVGSITQANTVTGVASAIDVSANTVALPATTFVTGSEVVVSISSGSLPTPIAAVTTYYVIKVNSGSVKLATTYAQAVAGIPIDITNQGDADKTITIKGTGQKSISVDIRGCRYVSIQANINYAVAAADAVGSVSIEASNDDVRWVIITNSSQNFTKSADCLIWEYDLNYNYVRTSTIVTTGGNGTLMGGLIACKIINS